MLAGSLCGFFAEAGEAGTVEDLITVLNTFGKRVGCRKLIAHLKSRRAQMLSCFVLAIECADLNQPPIVCVRCPR